MEFLYRRRVVLTHPPHSHGVFIQEASCTHPPTSLPWSFYTGGELCPPSHLTPMEFLYRRRVLPTHPPHSQGVFIQERSCSHPPTSLPLSFYTGGKLYPPNHLTPMSFIQEASCGHPPTSLTWSFYTGSELCPPIHLTPMELLYRKRVVPTHPPHSHGVFIQEASCSHPPTSLPWSFYTGGELCPPIHLTPMEFLFRRRVVPTHPPQSHGAFIQEASCTHPPT